MQRTPKLFKEYIHIEHDINSELLERVRFYISKPGLNFRTPLESGVKLVMTLRYFLFKKNWYLDRVDSVTRFDPVQIHIKNF